MADERIDRLLRRSANDVRAAVVSPASPPPIDVLERGHGRRWAVVASIVLVLAGLGGLLATTFGTDDEVAPAPPAATVVPADQTTVSPQLARKALCAAVTESTAALESTPVDTESWRQVGARLTAVETTADDASLDPDDDRRLDRFLLLAGLAVDHGVNGEQLTGAARADEAVAVGRDLVGSLAVAGCTVTPDPNSNSAPGGT